jgi:Fe-S-cluster containining protein
MRCSHCGICCTKTEMLLSKRDMTRLEKIGYQRNDFARENRNGYYKLLNREDHCVFHDRILERCKIYPNRPAGCKIYPVIYSVEEGVIVDYLCPENNTISKAELHRKGKTVEKLLATIDDEAAKRKRVKKVQPSLLQEDCNQS